jgi:hypothetical protein
MAEAWTAGETTWLREMLSDIPASPDDVSDENRYLRMT